MFSHIWRSSTQYKLEMGPEFFSLSLMTLRVWSHPRSLNSELGMTSHSGDNAAGKSWKKTSWTLSVVAVSIVG